MSEKLFFEPDRRLGLAFSAAAILALVAAGVYGVWQASLANIGPTFLLDLLPALIAVGVVPALAYRAYSLQRAHYTVERDGIQLRWGLRAEDVPMDQILWVRRAAEQDGTPPLPRLRWPGAVIGLRRLPATGSLSPATEIEYLADRGRDLVLIATHKRIFAISPAQTSDFLHTYQRLTELGSLSPLVAQSIYPSILLGRVWAKKPARFLLLTGLFSSLGLLVWASLAIPTRALVVIGFTPDGAPRDLVPAVRLLLLPFLNSILFIVDVILGLYFFRKEESQPLAYLLWGSGALTPLLFLIGVYFILNAG